MDVKEAVKTAKSYVGDLFSDETPVDLGLEEVEYDDSANVWNITVGFSRPQHSRNALADLVKAPLRVYKIVRVSDLTKNVLSVKNREITF